MSKCINTYVTVSVVELYFLIHLYCVVKLFCDKQTFFNLRTLNSDNLFLMLPGATAMLVDGMPFLKIELSIIWKQNDSPSIICVMKGVSGSILSARRYGHHRFAVYQTNSAL